MAVNHHYPVEVGNYLNVPQPSGLPPHWPNVSLAQYQANETWHITNEGHPAVDLGCGQNPNVGALAAVDGTIVTHPSPGGYGPNAFWIQGDDGLQYFYGHCAALLVANGAKVKAGDKIAIVGSLGHSTGIHIHFGVAPSVWPTADGGYGYGYPTGRTAQFLFDTAHGNNITPFDPNNPATVPPQKVPVTPPPPPPTFVQKTNKMLLAVPFAIEAKLGGKNAFWVHITEKDVSLSNSAIIASVMSETYGKPFDELVVYNLFGQKIQSKPAKSSRKLAPGIKLPFRVTIDFKKTSDWSLVSPNVGVILKEMIAQTFHYDLNNNRLFPTLYADQQKWSQQSPRVIKSTATGDFPSWKPIWINPNLWTESTAPVATKTITTKPELWYGQPGGTGGANGGTSSTPTGIISTRDKFIEMARGRGFKKALVYALLNNVEAESTFKSNVIEGGSLANEGTDFHTWPDNTGLGLFQFTNQVARDYFAAHNYNGKAILDGGNQLDYVFNVELVKPRYAALKAEIDKYQSGTTENYQIAVQLCELWTKIFEVPNLRDNPTLISDRCENREDVYNQLK